MTAASRQLGSGDQVTHAGDRHTVHVITASRPDGGVPSGVVFRVLPDLGGWIDADRFEPFESIAAAAPDERDEDLL